MVQAMTSVVTRRTREGSLENDHYSSSKGRHDCTVFVKNGIENDMSNVIKFTESDLRIKNLMQALEDVIYERGRGLQFATIIGTIDLLKLQLLDNQKENI